MCHFPAMNLLFDLGPAKPLWTHVAMPLGNRAYTGASGGLGGTDALSVPYCL